MLKFNLDSISLHLNGKASIDYYKTHGNMIVPRYTILLLMQDTNPVNLLHHSAFINFFL